MGMSTVPNLSLGSVLLRKKIDTQKEQPQEEVKQYGRYAKKEDSCNFFMFSPPEFSLVFIKLPYSFFRMIMAI